MILKNNSIFSGLLGLLLLLNIFQFSHFDPFHLSDAFSFLFLIIVPGLLLLWLLKLKTKSLWETIFLSSGLSLSFIMVSGLLVNQVLPKFGIQHPLALAPVLLSFDLLLLPLMLLVYKSKKRFLLHFSFFQWNKTTIFFFLFPILFPALAILGANSINNGGSNLLTLLLLGFISAYFILLSCLQKRINLVVFPTALYFIGLSLLLMTSLRSWFITGHDIRTEYYVFQLTKQHSLWSIDYFKDAYNACLSITILPTILSDFLHIDDAYIYKLVFQIIFALCPVIIFFFVKKFVKPILAFIATFYFLSFPTFFNDMPFLNRQEIGFIFFSLVLYEVFFSNSIKRVRNTLIVIFGSSVVISHYSTNYVMLFIFLSTYMVSRITNISFVKNYLKSLLQLAHIKQKIDFSENKFISVWMIIVFLLVTFIWNSQITKTMNNIQDVFGEVIYSFLIHSSQDEKSSDTSYSLFINQKPDPQKLLNEYIKEQATQANEINVGTFYPKNVYKPYTVKLLSQAVLPANQFGKFLTNFHFPLFTLQSLTRQISAAFIQILVAIGIVLFPFYKNIKKLQKEFVILCMTSVVLLALEIVLPDISAEYGLLRMFLQLLMIFSIPIIIATDFSSGFFEESKRFVISAMIVVFFFLTLTGFVSHLTGDYYPQLNLDNAGLYYDAYYTHKTDVASATWLTKHRNKALPVQTDDTGFGKLLMYGNFFSLDEILPPVIRQNAYVYLADSNNTVVSIQTNTFIFTSPKIFLTKNKNLIYSNGNDDIYK